ncbi:MAG: aminopeptidase family protein [Enterovirga sp.]|nr:aminopeptidase family protein [Enterovirga sp.]
MIDSRLNDIDDQEYRDRYRRAQDAMSREGIDLLIAWSDCYRMSNVRWLTNYRAFDGFIPYAAMTLVPAKGEPVLLVTEGLVPSAESSTWVKDVREIRRELPALLKEFAASGIRNVGVAGYRYLAAEFLDTIRECLPAPITVQRTSLLDVLKAVKSETEIRNMKVAGWLADVGCEAIADSVAVGVTERELARVAYSAMFDAGADGIAFDVFVQTGRENTERFYLKRPTDRPLEDGDIVMIDMGCRFNGYASDNARAATFGNASPEVRRALDATLEAFEAGMRHIRAGITGAEACEPANEVLRRHGYLKPGENLRCGHGTGMDPEEEYPSLMPDSSDLFLENMTAAYAITLLVPGVGGCRVEDPIVVRKDGAESLSNYSYTNHWPLR